MTPLSRPPALGPAPFCQRTARQPGPRVPSGAQRAEGHYRQALALATQLGMRPLVAECHLGLGKLNRRIGDRPTAHEHLTTAATLYREMDMGFWLERAEAELKALG